MNGRVFLTLAGLYLCCLLPGCSAVDEEARLLQALDKLIGAVEERSLKKVAAGLSDDFQPGRDSGIQDTRAFMQLQFRLNRVIHVITSDRQVILQDAQAQISFDALVTGSSHWLPERGRRFHVKSAWVRQGGEWKLQRLAWESLVPETQNW